MTKALCCKILEVVFLAPLLKGISIYKAYIRSRLEYCSVLLCGMGKTLVNSLESLQRRCIRIILKMSYCSEVTPEHYRTLGLSTLQARRNFALSCFAYKLFNGLSPRALTLYRPTQRVLPYNVRWPTYALPDGTLPTGSLMQRSCLILAARVLNIMDNDSVTRYGTMGEFKGYLVTLLTDESFMNFPFR